MLSDVCDHFLYTTKGKVKPAQMAKQAAELADDVDRYYNDGWYDQTVIDTVIRAARAVADAPHDQAVVARLKHLTTAVSDYLWYPPPSEDNAPRVAYYDKLYEEMVAAIAQVPSKSREKA